MLTHFNTAQRFEFVGFLVGVESFFLFDLFLELLLDDNVGFKVDNFLALEPTTFFVFLVCDDVEAPVLARLEDGEVVDLVTFLRSFSVESLALRLVVRADDYLFLLEKFAKSSFICFSSDFTFDFLTGSTLALLTFFPDAVFIDAFFVVVSSPFLVETSVLSLTLFRIGICC